MLAIVNLCVIWTKMLFEQQIPDGQGVQNVKGLYRLQSYYFPGKFYQVYPSIQLAKKECVSMFWPMANAGRKISKWFKVAEWWLVLFVTFDRWLKDVWGIYLLLTIHFVIKISNMIVVYVRVIEGDGFPQLVACITQTHIFTKHVDYKNWYTRDHVNERVVIRPGNRRSLCADDSWPSVTFSPSWQRTSDTLLFYHIWGR